MAVVRLLPVASSVPEFLTYKVEKSRSQKKQRMSGIKFFHFVFFP